MIQMSDRSNQWYALIAKPRQDKKLAQYLAFSAFEYYLPLVRQKHQWSDRTKNIDVPVMSPYVFVFTCEAERNRVFDSGSALSYVRRHGQTSIIAPNEIELIRHICTHGVEPTLQTATIQCGDRVQITAGPLKGMEGCILEVQGRWRFFVRLDGLGAWASCSIERKYLRRLDH